MPYNNFPMNYYYQPQMQPQIPQQVPQQNQQQVQQPVQQIQPQVQQGGFVPVNSENDARMYPVAPGNSVTFIDENSPYCYVKTMGFSQLDRPKFEKYRLVKEEDIPPVIEEAEKPEYITKDSLESLKTDFDSIRKEIEEIKEKITKLSKRRIVKEVEVDE